MSDDNRITIPCLGEIVVQNRSSSPLLHNLFSSARAKFTLFRRQVPVYLTIIPLVRVGYELVDSQINRENKKNKLKPKQKMPQKITRMLTYL